MSVDSQSEFFRSAEAALLQMIVRGRYRFHSHSWARISDEAKDFVRSLMCVDPTKRVTCEEALQHPWLRLHTFLSLRKLELPLSRSLTLVAKGST